MKKSCVGNKKSQNVENLDKNRPKTPFHAKIHKFKLVERRVDKVEKSKKHVVFRLLPKFPTIIPLPLKIFHRSMSINVEALGKTQTQKILLTKGKIGLSTVSAPLITTTT